MRLPALMIATAALAPHGAAASPRPVCGPKSARTVVATDRLRVFRRGADDVVCSRYSHRRWKLYRRPPCDGGSEGCDGRTLLAVAGRWVVQVSQHDGGGSGSSGRVNLRAAGARKSAMTHGVDNGRARAIAPAPDRPGAGAWPEGPVPSAVAGPPGTSTR